MKKLLCALTLLVPLVALGGCGKTADGTGPSVGDLISDAQKAAVAICGFAPAGQIVANVIATAVPGGAAVVTAAAIGSALCAAFAPPPKTLSLKGGKRVVRGWVVTPGAVNGVPIR